MADREKVIKALENCTAEIKCRDCPWDECEGQHEHVELPKGLALKTLELLKAQEPQWRPFVKRALTEEEQKHYPDCCYILDGEVPEDEEEILVYRPWNNKAGYIIEMDIYCNNGDEVYLDGAGDIENGMYWMPLPEPPKEET